MPLRHQIRHLSFCRQGDLAVTLDEMAHLHRACFANLRPWPAAEIGEVLRNPFAFALTQERAFLLGRALAGEAEIITLAVDPAVQRQGLGRALVRAFLQTARQKEAQSAFLEVAADNFAALALYKDCGFAQSGLRRAYYRTQSGKLVDAIVMTCLL
jgi:ribosomal-protein-alanine N-acetyltransferase